MQVSEATFDPSVYRQNLEYNASNRTAQRMRNW